LIESVPAASTVGFVLLVGFVVAESRVRYPLLPLDMFRSRQFSGANLTTFAVYAALAASLFLVVLQLQNGLAYSALEAGVALLPVTVITLLLSARMGAMSQKFGTRLFMTVGPLVVAVGMVMYARIEPGRGYVDTVLPATIVFGLGLATLVAPLTATVLAAVDVGHASTASGVNNAVARLAGLLAVAVLPGLAGLGDPGPGQSLGDPYVTAMRISAGLCVLGAAAAFATVRTAKPHAPAVTPVGRACHAACVADTGRERRAA
jgi:Na+/melibiose symporter-like transporter